MPGDRDLNGAELMNVRGETTEPLAHVLSLPVMLPCVMNNENSLGVVFSRDKRNCVNSDTLQWSERKGLVQLPRQLYIY